MHLLSQKQLFSHSFTVVLFSHKNGCWIIHVLELLQPYNNNQSVFPSYILPVIRILFVVELSDLSYSYNLCSVIFSKKEEKGNCARFRFKLMLGVFISSVNRNCGASEKSQCGPF